LTPDTHSRAVSQLHSVLRDLGIATRALAAYKEDSPAPGPVSLDLAVHASDGARLLLDAWQRLDGVLAAEAIPPSGDPDDPGSALCQAARDAILAWRRPSGTAADRDDTLRCLVTATRLIGDAIAGLAACASRQLAKSLQDAAARLGAATACLAAAIQPDEDKVPPGSRDGEQQ
jgi:hypothetical protein